MLNTKEEFLASSGVVVVSKTLAEDLVRSTRNAALKALITDKEKVVITNDLRTNLITRLQQLSTQAEVIRSKRVTKGGRHKLPDITQEELDNMSKEEKLRYRNRMWKRNQRDRDKLNESQI